MVLPPLQDAAPTPPPPTSPAPGTSSCTKHPTTSSPRSTPSVPPPRSDQETPRGLRTSGAELAYAKDGDVDQRSGGHPHDGPRRDPRVEILTIPTAGIYELDPAHERVGFVARHLMVAKVRGEFPEAQATITIAEDPLLSSVTATIQAAGITTGRPDRDQHLVSGLPRGGELPHVRVRQHRREVAQRQHVRPHRRPDDQGCHPPSGTRGRVRGRRPQPLQDRTLRVQRQHRDRPRGLRPDLEGRLGNRRRGSRPQDQG